MKVAHKVSLSMLIYSLLILIFSFPLVNAGSVCPLVISGNNNTYILNTSVSCINNTVIFSANARSNLLECNLHSINSIGTAVIFLNNTFNNTVVNCTINGKILSMHNAQNNIVNVTGNYSLVFYDNSSNIAIGNFFHLLLYGPNREYAIGRFIQLMPNVLAEKAPYLVAMNQKMRDFIDAAKEYALPIPRFGIFPNASCNGSCYFMLESEEISKNNTINFNPYLYSTPYWGFDILGYTRFNISRNVLYEPAYISPFIYQDEILPANKPVYWNYTIIFNTPTKVNKLRLLNGWQGDPDATLQATFYNITSGKFVYERGYQKPGVYEFIALLDTPYDHENSTTETYSVGLSYCSGGMGGISAPGYYPFAYNSLNQINVFWLTNKICSIGMDIGASNVLINCRGGYVKSTNVDFRVSGQTNVTIENCLLYGNGILAASSNLTIYNTTFIANSSVDKAIWANNSDISLYDVKFVNFLKPIESFNSIINTLNSSITIVPPSIITTSITSVPTTLTSTISPTSAILKYHNQVNIKAVILIIALDLFISILSFIIYLLIGRFYDSKSRPKSP
ncbi:MAG: hypothetical protein RXP92_00780 [Candidatus Micrarchaeota archaeon]